MALARVRHNAEPRCPQRDKARRVRLLTARIACQCCAGCRLFASLWHTGRDVHVSRFLNATRNCDRAVRLTGNQTVLFTYHAFDPCVCRQCTGQHAPTVKHSFDWRRSFVRPAMMAPTPAPPLCTLRAAALRQPILRAINPANANVSFFEASWVAQRERSVCSSRAVRAQPAAGSRSAFAPTTRCQSEGTRQDAHVHRLVRRRHRQCAPDRGGLAEHNVGAGRASRVQQCRRCQLAAGSVFQGGTAVRFAVRVANWKRADRRARRRRAAIAVWQGAADSLGTLAPPIRLRRPMARAPTRRSQWCAPPLLLHCRISARAPSAGSRAIWSCSVAVWRCVTTRVALPRSPTRCLPSSGASSTTRRFAFACRRRPPAMCRSAGARTARSTAGTSRATWWWLDRRARRAARARHLVRQSAAAGVGRRAKRRARRRLEQGRRADHRV
jgi:hypothetical protein